MADTERWWAKGLLFENCNCQLLCPAHVSWKQKCNYERCVGYWAVHIKDGMYGEVLLGGLNALVFLDMPQVMASGGGKQAIYIDERANHQQRVALEKIFSGQGGSGLSARFKDRDLVLTTEASHAIYGEFSWKGP